MPCLQDTFQPKPVYRSAKAGLYLSASFYMGNYLALLGSFFPLWPEISAVSESSHSCISRRLSSLSSVWASENQSWDVLEEHTLSAEMAVSRGRLRPLPQREVRAGGKEQLEWWSKTRRKGKYKMSYPSHASINVHTLPFCFMVWIHETGSKKCFSGVPS